MFFKQKTAYGMLISDWSSDVCSSDLLDMVDRLRVQQRLEQHVGKAQREEVLDRFLAGIMVDAKDMIIGEGAADLLVDGWRRSEVVRLEEGRVGKEWVRTCRSGWERSHKKKTKSKRKLRQQLNT